MNFQICSKTRSKNIAVSPLPETEPEQQAVEYLLATMLFPCRNLTASESWQNSPVTRPLLPYRRERSLTISRKKLNRAAGFTRRIQRKSSVLSAAPSQTTLQVHDPSNTAPQENISQEFLLSCPRAICLIFHEGNVWRMNMGCFTSTCL